MKSYINLITKGILLVCLTFASLSISAQNNLRSISTSAIESGFDIDIFETKYVKKAKVSSRDFFEENEMDELSSYDQLQPKGKKTNSYIIQESRVLTYNENMYPEPVAEGFSGYKIEILHTMEQIQDNNPIFYKHGRICEEQLNDMSFSYLVGSFEKSGQVDDFMRKFIAADYPDATVVHYKNGERD